MKVHYCIEDIDLLVSVWSSTADLVVGVDTETTGLSSRAAKLRTIQFAIDNHVFVVDCFKVPDVFSKLKTLIDSRDDLIIVMHNLKFDMQFLWANGIDIDHLRIMDTMLTAQIIAAGLPLGFGLDDLAGRFLNIYVTKDEQRSDWSVENLTQSQIKYAAIDAVTVKKLYPILKRLVLDNNLKELYELEHRCVFATAAMEFFGVRCNLDTITAMEPYFEQKLQEAQHAFLAKVTTRYETVDFDGNVVHPGLELSSNSQVLRSLQALGIKDPLELDLPLQSTGTSHLKLIDDLTEYPALLALFEFRKASKLLTSYIHSLPNLVNPVTNRLHTNYRQMVSTGRFSSSNPNLQQMPRPSKDNPVNIRDAFEAEEGYVFVQADYCLAAGTRVATQRGLVPIELVTNQDIVYQDIEGQTQKVLSVIDRGYLDVIELTTKSGYTLKCTKNHRLRVIDKNNKYTWKVAGEIDSSDQIAIAAGRGIEQLTNYYNLPEVTYTHLNQKQVQFPKYADECFAEFIGYLTGDGSFSSGCLKWVVCDKDKEVFDHIQKYVEDTFGRVSCSRQYQGVYESGIHSVPLVRTLGFLGISKSTVPGFLYQSPLSVVCAYLRGLFESDGSVGDRISFCATDLDFIKEVQRLLLAVGIPALLREQSMSKLATKQPYLLIIPSAYAKAFSFVIGFISERKSANLAKLIMTSGYSSSYGGLNINREHLKSLNLKGKEYSILRNSINLDRKVSLATAAKLVEQNLQLATELNLSKIVLDNHFYDKLVSIEEAGQYQCFDLEVENTNTYIADGFVNHNSQIELRVMAEVVYTLTGDDSMLNEFLQGKDPYTNTASLLMGYDYDSMFEDGVLKKEYKSVRQSAKAVRLGLNYAMQPKKLKNYSKQTYGVDMSNDEALKYVERYFEAYPGLAVYHQSCNTPELKRHPIAYSLPPFRRPRVWEEFPGPSGLSNHPIQGSSADITKLGMAMIYEKLYDLGYSPTQSWDIRPVLTIHDEVVLESLDNLKDTAASVLKESMIDAAQAVLKVCPVEAEVNFMKTLAEK